MKKKYVIALLALMMVVPFTSVKAQYDAGDSTACYNIMINNFSSTNLLNWNDPNPGNWLGVTWNSASPQRIVEFTLQVDGDDMGLHSGGFGLNEPNNHGNNVPHPTFNTGAGVPSQLLGNVDFSPFAELVRLCLTRQDSITNFNVTGLNNLEYIVYPNPEMVQSFELGNLPNLRHVWGYSLKATKVDISNCPRLKTFRYWDGSNTVDTLLISGSDSITYLNLKKGLSANAFPQILDFTNMIDLYILILNGGDNGVQGNLTSLEGIENCSKLVQLRVGNNKLDGNIDIAWFNTDSLYRFAVGKNNLDSISNWMTLVGNPNLEKVAFHENELTLNNSVQIFNEINPSSSFYGDPQTRYGGDTIYVPATKDYSAEALIDINGNNIASSFELYDYTGTPVGWLNNTGIFNFPTVNDTGEYYVEMINPGAAPANNDVVLTTNNFWVRCLAGTGSQTLTICYGDNVVVGTSVYTTTGSFVYAFAGANGCDSLYTTNLTVKAPVDTSTTLAGFQISSNQAGATYQWVDCNNGNSPIAGATAQNYVATANGDYAVEVTTINGCTDTSACVNISGVGIYEYATSFVNIYPNPVSNMFTIELSELANTQLTVLSVDGKLVYNKLAVNNMKTVIDATDWSKGVYFVTITDDNSIKTVRLIK